MGRSQMILAGYFQNRWGRRAGLMGILGARKAWLQVHLYLGLFAGALLMLLGITGSVLVFSQAFSTVLCHFIVKKTLEIGRDHEIFVIAKEREMPRCLCIGCYLSNFNSD